MVRIYDPSFADYLRRSDIVGYPEPPIVSGRQAMMLSDFRPQLTELDWRSACRNHLRAEIGDL